MPRVQATVTEWDCGDLAPIQVLLDDVMRAHARDGVDLRAIEHGFEQRWAAMCSKQENRVLVAWVDGNPAGVAVVTEQPMDPWSDRAAGVISLMHVRAEFRKRGIAQVLLRQTLAIAEEKHWADLLVHVSPSLRDSQRYFARLGFAPAVTRRVTTVDGLRRKLGVEPTRARLMVPRLPKRAAVARLSL